MHDGVGEVGMKESERKRESDTGKEREGSASRKRVSPYRITLDLIKFERC